MCIFSIPCNHVTFWNESISALERRKWGEDISYQEKCQAQGGLTESHIDWVIFVLARTDPFPCCCTLPPPSSSSVLCGFLLHASLLVFSSCISFWVILPTELYPAGIKTSTWNMLWDVHPVSCLKGQQSWRGDVTCLNGSYLAMSFSFIFFFFCLWKKSYLTQGREQGICSAMNVYLLFTSEMPMSICAV